MLFINKFIIHVFTIKSDLRLLFGIIVATFTAFVS
jgi:hypothetical protein